MIALGMAIEVCVIALQDRGWLQDASDATGDVVVRLAAGMAAYPERLTPITFVDVDDATYQAWDEPLQLPRDHLARIVRHAVESQAAVVIIDVDLTHPGIGDLVLRDYLEKGPSVPVLLVQSLYTVKHDPEAISPEMLLPRASILDPDLSPSGLLQKITELSGNVYRAAPTFGAGGDDRIVRRWRPWQPICVAHTPKALPSMPTLAVTLVANNANDARDALMKAVQNAQPGWCHQQTQQPANIPSIRLGDRDLSLDSTRFDRRRIVFTLGWPYRNEAAKPLVRAGDRIFPLLTHLPAHQLVAALERADRSETVPVSKDSFQGHIVIIGGSFVASRDLYETPLGLMPGAMIIANAIVSLQQFGAIEPAPWPKRIALAALYVVIVCVAFSALSPLFASIVSTLALATAPLLAAVVLVRHGYWLDPVIVGVGILVLQWVVEILSHLEDRIGRRRALSLAALLAANLAFGSAAMAEEAKSARLPAARVLDLSGDQDAFFVGRGKDRPQLLPYADLYEDDVVIVAKPGAEARLLIYSAGEIGVTDATSPYRVPPRPPERSRFMVFADNVIDILQRQNPFQTTPDTNVTANVRAGEEPPTIKLLPKGRVQQVLPGTRGFVIAWSGGEPPYVLALRSTRAKSPTLRQEGLLEPASRLQQVNLTSGLYEIEVTDVRRRRASGSMKVIGPNDPVPMPPVQGEEAVVLEPDTRDLLGAIWLAGQGRDSWRLEAYLRLLNRNDTPATLARAALARGADVAGLQ